ncbi:MAG: 23S rRNA (adenine(2503)-C(2))-methyltransferase RlmN [Parvibaculales bacterium]
MTLGVPEPKAGMRTSQIWNWFYARNCHDFSKMHTLDKALRETLSQELTLHFPDITSEQVSKDGTIKWLLKLAEGQEVECVYIPTKKRGTLCVSSQIGCTLNCRFCHTGTQNLVRNLEASEIVAQLLLANQRLATLKAGTITNMVFMGMGEPLYNFDNVKKAIEIMSDKDGLQLSKRRITLSTAGVVPQIERCGEEIGVMLAISLHAVRDDIRTQLVPLNKKYPLADLLEACKNYKGLRNARRITFEYVMLKDINDSDADAKELVRLLRDIPAKINLIPFNAWEGAPYECSSNNRMRAFGEIVNKAGFPAPLRTPRGSDIMAACGQLKTASEKLRKAR